MYEHLILFFVFYFVFWYQACAVKTAKRRDSKKSRGDKTFSGVFIVVGGLAAKREEAG
jgi:hypothetical protein